MLSITLICMFLVTALAQTVLQVTTLNGTVAGIKCPESSASQFLSIPFAEPPLGNLRFAPPKPYNRKYSGTLNATSAGPSCIQFGSDFQTETGPTSEDCLFLNVWVPGNVTTTSALPIKVWIHGGFGTTGSTSDPLYNGCSLATDSIVVSISYRVGPLGFFALKSAGVQGNMAVQDVELGLKWVQTNIGRFGGDAKKVLVFGQSFGAQLAFILSTLPSASALMNAVVLESGGGKDYIPTNNSKIQSFGANWVTALGCTVSDLACIQSKSTNQLNASLPAAPITRADNPGIITSFQPSVDGIVIPVNPASVGNRVPAVFGSTTLEGTLFILGGYKFPPSADDYSKFLTSTFGVSAPLVNAAYSLAKFNSTPYPAFYAMSSVFTDFAFKCPAYRGLLKSASKNIPSWSYSWAKAPTCSWNQVLPNNPQVLQLLGPTHSAELPFVFNNTNRLPLPNGACNLGAYERDLAKVVAAAWTSLADQGTVNGQGIAKLNWPQFSTQDSAGLIVSNTSYSTGMVDYSVCQLWNALNLGMLANSTGTSIASPSSSVAATSGAIGSISFPGSLPISIIATLIAAYALT